MTGRRTGWDTTVSGAIAGLTVALAYFSLEQLMLRVLPFFLGTMSVMLLPWDITAFFLIVHCGLGIVLGIVGVWLVRAARIGGPNPDGAQRLAALILMLVVVLAANTTSDQPSAFVGAALAGSAAVCLVVLMAWPGCRWLEPYTGHWTVWVATTGILWIVKTWFATSKWDRKVVPMVMCLVIAAAATALVQWTWRRLAGPGPVARRTHLAVAGGVALIVAALAIVLQPAPLRAAVAAPPPAGVRRPPVFLIVLDTVRADHLSLYGYQRDTTPRLREFAGSATLFRNATATADMTLPTHASMFTGVFASSHGAHYSPSAPLGSPLDGKALTLAEILRASGYRTLALVSNYAYVSAKFGFAQGFEYYDARAGTPFLGGWTHAALRERSRKIAAWLAGRDPHVGPYRDAAAMTAEAARALAGEAGSGRPLFLFLNLMDAHRPVAPAPPFDRMFPGWESPISVPEFDELIESVNERRRTLTSREREFAVSQYDGALAFLDARLGDFFDDLRRRELFDDSLIVVTSDHGEAFGEKSLMEHAVSVYENQVRVPLAIKWPGQKTAETVEERVSQVDILPTVLAAAGLAAPGGVSGVDLAKVHGTGPRWIYSESFARAPGSRFRRIERAVFRDNIKLIASDKGMREMYDLSADPLEDRNLYRPDHPQARELTSHLNDWIRTVPKAPASPTTLDAETRERLRSLGYIQ